MPAADELKRPLIGLGILALAAVLYTVWLAGRSGSPGRRPPTSTISPTAVPAPEVSVEAEPPPSPLSRMVDQARETPASTGRVLPPEEAAEIYRDFLRRQNEATSTYTKEASPDGKRVTVRWTQRNPDGTRHSRHETRTLGSDGIWRTPFLRIENGEGEWTLVGTQAILVPRDPDADAAQKAKMATMVTDFTSISGQLSQSATPEVQFHGIEATIGDAVSYIIGLKLPEERIRRALELMQQMGQVSPNRAAAMLANMRTEMIYVIDQRTRALRAEIWIGADGTRRFTEEYEEASLNEPPPADAFSIPPSASRRTVSAAEKDAAIQAIIREQTQ